MKFILTLLIALHTIYVSAQTSPRFTKYNIGKSGCAAYLPSKPGDATEEYSPDSSLVYTIESVIDSFHFGVILVKTNFTIEEEEREGLLEEYLNYLKGSLNIEASVGYGKGHALESHAGTKGIIDYWTDKDKDQWKIKGWVNDHFISVMYVYGPAEYPNYNVMEVFFKGIRFPGDK